MGEALNKARLTVIMPVYNAATYLQETVNSLVDQSAKDFIVLACNDASTDASGEILRNIRDPRFVYLENDRNRGYVYSLNRMLPMVQTEFVARMDADDKCHPDRFSKQLHYLLSHPEIDLVGSSVLIDRQDSASRRTEVWDYPATPQGVKARLLFNTAHAHPSVMFRRSLIDRGIYVYDPEFYPAEDFRLWVELGRQVQTSNLPDALLTYRVTAGQTSIQSLSLQQERACMIRAIQFEYLMNGISTATRDQVYRFWQSPEAAPTAFAIRLLTDLDALYASVDDHQFRAELASQMQRMVRSMIRWHPSLFNVYLRAKAHSQCPLGGLDYVRYIRSIILAFLNR